MQHRQGECSGFACAGLRAAKQIVPGQNQGNGLLLNGGWLGIADAVYGFDNGRSQF